MHFCYPNNILHPDERLGSTRTRLGSTRQQEITIEIGLSVTLINDDPLTPHIIANRTWDNGAAKLAKEPNAPEVNKVILRPYDPLPVTILLMCHL